MRIAITGHRGLPPETSRLVDQGIRDELRELDAMAVVGVSCLADGADQLFAQAVLDSGGTLEVVVPAKEYRDGLPEEAHAAYDDLMSRAVHVHKLDHTESTAEAHMAASKEMLADADVLFAVWDGKPARGYGGTADIVQIACDRGIPVRVIWPRGARRDEPAQAL